MVDYLLPEGPFWSPSRILSGLLALAYTVTAWRSWGPAGSLKVLGSCVLPLACVWFPEELGEYTGFFSMNAPITSKSPPSALHFMGWVVLLLPVIVIPFHYLGAWLAR